MHPKVSPEKVVREVRRKTRQSVFLRGEDPYYFGGSSRRGQPSVDALVAEVCTDLAYGFFFSDDSDDLHLRATKTVIFPYRYSQTKFSIPSYSSNFICNREINSKCVEFAQM